ncbi:MAG: glycosyltransferase family 2 protein [Clostridia bacterium]|nr:glycosyltransferase family 2 protein [Clostridia bacterium]
MNKKISIIIPCYNCESTLVRCLDSILSQTYENIEVIIANDGSSDKTEEIALSYKDKFKNFIYLPLPRGGVSVARNKGLEVATGEFIQFVDSDDNFTKRNALDKAMRLLNHYGVDVVAYNFTHPCFETHLPSGVYNLKNESDLTAYYQDFFVMNLPWNKLYKREVITEQFPVGVAFAEDELFNLANLKNISKVYFTDEVLYNYYCAKPQKNGRVSAINEAFANGNFLKTKDTIWYKGLRNDGARQKICDSDFPTLTDYFRSVRIFDFFFWNLEFLCNIRADERSVAKECERIMSESEFIWALNYKQKFGIKSLKLPDKNRFSLFISFARESIKAFDIVKRQKKGNNVYFALMAIFAKYFLDFDRNSLILSDDCAKAVAFSGVRTDENVTFYVTSEARV